MNKNPEFIDAEDYQGKQAQPTSFHTIVLEHLKKVTSFASKEMGAGGYWQRKAKSIQGVAFVEEFYVEDSREIYANAVDCLSDILLPFFDKEMKQKEKILTQELKNIYKKHIQTSNNQRLDRHTYRNEKFKIKRKLFRMLNLFLHRKGYLEGKSFEEAA